MNDRQRQVLEWLRRNPRSELYETASPHNSREGSGFFNATYSGGTALAALTRAEVDELVRAGELVQVDSSVQIYRLRRGAS